MFILSRTTKSQHTEISNNLYAKEKGYHVSSVVNKFGQNQMNSC